MDHEIRSDEEADFLAFQIEEAAAVADGEAEDLYGQTDEELDEMIANWEKNEQKEL